VIPVSVMTPPGGVGVLVGDFLAFYIEGCRTSRNLEFATICTFAGAGASFEQRDAQRRHRIDRGAAIPRRARPVWPPTVWLRTTVKVLPTIAVYLTYSALRFDVVIELQITGIANRQARV